MTFWILAVTAVLVLAGMTIQQVYFNIATAETSSSAIYDTWNGDPRQTCAPFKDESGANGWQCTPNPGVVNATIRFYAGECNGSDDYDQVFLDLPAKQVDAVEQQLVSSNRPWPGDILVTYHPKIFGFIGEDEVLNVEVMPASSTCGNGSGY